MSFIVIKGALLVLLDVSPNMEPVFFRYSTAWRRREGQTIIIPPTTRPPSACAAVKSVLSILSARPPPRLYG